MRRLTLGVTLLLLGSAVGSRTTAQQGPRPQLVLTLLGGVVNGADLWTIDRQPFYGDTLRLARNITSSLLVGAAMTYFPGRYVGVHVELAYLGLPLSDACAVLNSNASQTSVNVCADVQGASHSTGAIGFTANAIVRATPGHGLSPYLRTGLGVIGYDHSTIEMAGASGDTTYQVLRDDAPRRFTPSLALAGGVTVALGPGYQFRLEVQDVMAAFEYVTGAGDALLQPRTGTRFFHHVGLTMGLDVVLEQKRGRRY